MTSYSTPRERLHARKSRAGSGDKSLGFSTLLLTGIVLVVLSQVLVLALGQVPTLQGEFFGFDTYNRMARVQALWEHGEWFSAFDPGISAPKGFQSHWSRPLDGLIVALAAVFHLFLTESQALFWAGSLVSPLLNVLAFVAVMLILRPAASSSWIENLPLVFVLCYPFTNAFHIGRPDHHSAELAANLVLLALLARALLTRPGVGLGIAVGLVASLGAWIEISGFLLAIAVLAGIGVLWCLYGRSYLRFGLSVHLSLLAGLLACTFLERGPTAEILLAMEGDRISLMHAMLAALPLVFWLGGLVLARRGIDRKFSNRAGWACATAVVVGGGALLVLPSFQYLAILGVDAYYFANRSQTISEYQSVFDAATVEGVDTVGGIAAIFRFIWVYALGLIALIWLIARSEEPQRPLHIALATIFGLSILYHWDQYFGLQFRHMPYFSAIMLLPLLTGIDRLLSRWQGNGGVDILGRLAVRAPVILLPIAANLVFALALANAAAKNESAANQPPPNGDAVADTAERETAPCQVGPAKAALSRIGDPTGQAPTFLALPELSGKLDYHLGVNIFAIGQHRYQAGFKPMLETFRSRDVVEIERSLRTHGVDAVVLCNISKRLGGYFEGMEGDDYFYRRLQLDDPPAFLKPFDTGYPGLKAYVLRPKRG